MTLFTAFPSLAAVIGLALFALGRLRRRGAALAVGWAWVLYSVYEYGMYRRWLCSGECNIRVDLLLIYPVLAVLSLWAVVGLFRTARPEAS